MKILLGLFLVVGSLAQANSVSNTTLYKDIQKFIISEKGSPKTNRLTCTDFSGTWQGECKDQGGQVDKGGVWISQRSCDEVSVDLILGDIKKTIGLSIQDDLTNANIETSLEWVNDQTELARISTLHGRLTEKGRVAFHSADSTRYTMNLDGTLSAKTSGFIAATVDGKQVEARTTRECIFKK